MSFTPQTTPGTPVVTNVQVTTQTAKNNNGHSMSPTMRDFYSRNLLENARENLYLMQFAEKEKIHGNTVKFRKFDTFDYMPDNVLLQEGVVPDGKQFGMSEKSVSCYQYGAYTAISDRLEMEAVDNVILGCTEEHAVRAAEVMEIICRDALSAGENAACAPSVSGGAETEIDTPLDLTTSCVLTSRLLAKIATYLKKNKVPKIKGWWIAYVHPDNVFDLRNDPDWKEAHVHGDQEEIYNGEIGRFQGFVFIESNFCRVHAPAVISDTKVRLTVAADTSGASQTVYVKEELTAAATCSIDVYVDGTANKITAIAAGTGDNAAYTALTLQTAATVSANKIICGQGGTKSGVAYYDCLFFGAKAFGTSEPDGESLQTIVKGRSEAGGPLEQFSTVGWKAVTGAAILYPERVLRLECSSSLAADMTDSN